MVPGVSPLQETKVPYLQVLWTVLSGHLWATGSTGLVTHGNEFSLGPLEPGGRYLFWGGYEVPIKLGPFDSQTLKLRGAVHFKAQRWAFHFFLLTGTGC